MAESISAEFLALQELLAGRYSIERELGRGGMGIVLLARDVALDRLVAIKLLPPTLAAQAATRDRFLTEARTAAGLSHPNIVPIHVVEEHGDLVFFVMGYVDGETLRERVERRGPLSSRAATKLLQEVAWALGYAHQRGVVHRDVKPDNIMIERATERAIVMDFGIAQVERYAERHEPGSITGTARYMSPEQASGEPVDARSDLYSLGATAFYALTGHAPFEAASVPALLAKHVAEPAPRLVRVQPNVPAKLGELVNRCLEKDPERRLQSGEELAAALDVVRGRDMRAPPLVRSFVRNAQVTTMIVLTILLVGGGTGVAVRSGGGVSINFGALILGGGFVVQLVGVARRLLRDGYAFEDIRQALLAEARAQSEEADLVEQGKWMRRLDSLWSRLWAGRVGRLFFKVAGWGIEPEVRRALPSVDATELVLGRAATEVFDSLPPDQRAQLGEVPQVIGKLERRAEQLRERGATGPELTDTVAALERMRIELLRLRAGMANVRDLTEQLARARAIGDAVDRHLEARDEVERLLEDRA